MKIAFFYDFDPKQKEEWHIGYGMRIELQRRGYETKAYALPSHDKSYGFRESIEDMKSGKFVPDVAFLSNAGPLTNADSYWHKENFGMCLMVQECGDEPQTYQSHMVLTNQSDLVFTPDLRCHFAYQNRGIKSVWVTHWADTLVYYPDDTEKTKECSTTTGSRGNGLTEWLEENLGDKFLNIRGPEGSYISGKENGDLFRESKMVFQFANNGEITRRIFEGAACGAMVITSKIDASTGIYDIFEEGIDIIYYNSPNECLEKIEYYLEHDQEREKIAYSAHQKVMASHTLRNRMDTMLNKMEQMI
tara:strand:+ start:31185 stop:32096 length:912 start_codon:yes stop_codon:yes gene_type:complete